MSNSDSHQNPICDNEDIKRIDPFTDTGFKTLFGKPDQSEPLLMDFLNDIFEGQKGFERIKSVSYGDKEKIRDNPHAKSIIYDINCETENGHKFIVEMQKGWQDFFLKRAVYYVSNAIASQGHKGSGEKDWEFDFKPVAGVFLCDFKLKNLPKRLITHVRLTDTEDNSAIGNYLHFVFIQTWMFDKTEQECESGFDIWMYTLKNLKTMREIPFKTRKDEVFERLDRISRYSALSEEEQADYNRDLKWARDYNAILNSAKREAIAEGREEGRAEGRIEGRAEGREEGRIQGREEEKLGIAKNALGMGMAISDIAKLTGLSEQQIKSLQ